MRLRARPSALFAVLLLLALPAVAAADIKPIFKPETTRVQPAKPPAKPVDRTPARTPPATTRTPPSTTSSSTGSAQTRPTTPARTGATKTRAKKPAKKVSTTATTVKIVAVSSEGGRDQSGVVAPLPPPPEPTPLALVAASEVVPTQDSATPAWKLALLALLAAAEAFLVVRLVRHRPVTLSPAR